MRPLCTVDDCLSPFHARGLCIKHYNRLMKHGSTDDPRPTTEQRFWSKVDKTADCWLWTGNTSSGYGTFGVGGRQEKKTVYAHRWSYEAATGTAIPAGLHLDHLCRTPRCVRPDHLELVTPQVNILRGIAPSATAHRTGICQRGHEFTPENTYVRSDSNRVMCRECCRIRARRRYSQERAA